MPLRGEKSDFRQGYTVGVKLIGEWVRLGWDRDGWWSKGWFVHAVWEDYV